MPRMRAWIMVAAALGACADPATHPPARDTADADIAPVDEPDATPPAPRFPDPEWPTATPAEVGLDEAALDEAAAYADSIGSSCLVVVRDGQLVYERYFGDTTADSVQKSWSIAKSFTSALVGIAIDRGEIESVDQPAADFIPSWRGTDKEAITIAHLLSMDSGLKYDLVTDNTWVMFTNDHTAEAIGYDAPDPPGVVWHYNSHGVQVLDAVLEAATGMDPEDYARAHLWSRIGMDERTHWDRDGAGNATLYMSVFATCRDLARFGYLYLNEGNWNGEQIVSREWVAASLSPSQALNPIYGYLWWLNGGEPAKGSTDEMFDGTMFNFAPDDLFSAQGLGQSFIDVVPGTSTMYIHVRRAPHDPFTKFLTDPAGTMDALLHDGLRAEHKLLLRALLDAG
jgi:CubicO group peptidase (beta-lactamase class C family)